MFVLVSRACLCVRGLTVEGSQALLAEPVHDLSHWKVIRMGLPGYIFASLGCEPRNERTPFPPHLGTISEDVYRPVQ